MTELEISGFGAELVEITQEKDLDTAFNTALEKTHEYLRCDSLIYSVTTVMGNCLILNQIDICSTEKYIIRLIQRLLTLDSRVY